jgi:hypothetical protein
LGAIVVVSRSLVNFLGGVSRGGEEGSLKVAEAEKCQQLAERRSELNARLKGIKVVKCGGKGKREE